MALKRTRSAKAKIFFPVGRIASWMRADGMAGGRLSASAPVFLAAAVERIVDQVVADANELARRDGKGRITPKYIQRAVRKDPGMARAFARARFAEAGAPRQLAQI